MIPRKELEIRLMVAELDRATLRDGILALRDLMRSGEAPKGSVPAHFKALVAWAEAMRHELPTLKQEKDHGRQG